MCVYITHTHITCVCMCVCVLAYWWIAVWNWRGELVGICLWPRKVRVARVALSPTDFTFAEATGGTDFGCSVGWAARGGGGGRWVFESLIRLRLLGCWLCWFRCRSCGICTDGDAVVWL